MKKFARFILDACFLALSALAIIFAALYITQENRVSDLFKNVGDLKITLSDIVKDADRIIAWVTIVIGAITFVSVLLSMLLFWRKSKWSWTVFNLVFVVLVVALGAYVAYVYFDINNYNSIESLKTIFS